MKRLIWLLGIVTFLLSASYVCKAAQDDEVVWQLDLKHEIASVAFHPDGSKVYCAVNRIIEERSAVNGDLLRIFKKEDNIGYVDIEVSQDGKYLVASDISSIHSWFIETGEFYKEFKLKEDDIAGYILFSDISLSPDGKKLAGVGQAVMYSPENNLHLIVFDFTSGDTLFHFFKPPSVFEDGMIFKKVQFSHSNDYFITVNLKPSKQIMIWDSENFIVVNTINLKCEDLKDFHNIKFSNNKNFKFLMYSELTQFYIYDLNNKQIKFNLDLSDSNGVTFFIEASNQYDKIILGGFKNGKRFLELYNIKNSIMEYKYSDILFSSYSNLSLDDKYIVLFYITNLKLIKTKWDATGKTDEYEKTFGYNVYPNPITNNINIRFINEIPGMINIKIIDLDGNIIAELINKYCIEEHLNLYFSTENITNGTYFINIQKDKKEIYSEKIIINK